MFFLPFEAVKSENDEKKQGSHGESTVQASALMHFEF